MAAPGAIIYQWLDRIGLGYAVPHFQAAGITTPQQLAAIEMAEGAADRLNIASGECGGAGFGGPRPPNGYRRRPPAPAPRRPASPPRRPRAES
jgi:hypothetical protein